MAGIDLFHIGYADWQFACLSLAGAAGIHWIILIAFAHYPVIFGAGIQCALALMAFIFHCLTDPVDAAGQLIHHAVL